MFRYLTAGESHGREVLAVVEGLPAGLQVDLDLINAELRRRQGGYGRGGRQRIERDTVEVVTGLRRGKTIGAPVTLKLINRDYKIDTLHAMARPRPGHGDLAGALKYGLTDARDVLERASARETAARVMAGALARQVLAAFDVDCFAFVSRLGGNALAEPDLMRLKLPAARRARNRSEFYQLEPARDGAIKRMVNRIAATGDTLGGVVTGLVRGLPAGVGNHTQWDRKLDGRLAQALMSIQAIKGVEIGLGFGAAAVPGSKAHDDIRFKKNGRATSGGFFRGSNRAGGLEAGIANGEDIVIRAAMKPISTLRPPKRPRSVDLKSKRRAASTHERGDITAVPAASVVVENVLALVCVDAFLEKFGGDTMRELRRNYDGYLRRLGRP